MNGQQWLARVFEPALATDAVAYVSQYDALRGQLRALHDCQVLSTEAVAEAEHRLDRARQAGRSRRRPPVRPAGSQAPPPTNRLLRLLAFGEPLADIGAVTLVLASVELWQQRVDLLLAGMHSAETDRRDRQFARDLQTWAGSRRNGSGPAAVAAPPRMPGSDLYHAPIRLTDDLGTGYQHMHASASGGAGTGTEWRIHHSYSPGVPEQAAGLVLTVFDEDDRPLRRLEIPL